MLGKTLLNLDQVGRAIAPEFDPNASIRRNAAQIMQQRLVRSLSPGNLFSGMLELKDLVQRLPARLNKILDAISNNELKVTVDAIDERTLIDGFQKVANRITVGLILASLIVGAASSCGSTPPSASGVIPGLRSFSSSPRPAAGSRF